MRFRGGDLLVFGDRVFWEEEERVVLDLAVGLTRAVAENFAEGVVGGAVGEDLFLDRVEEELFWDFLTLVESEDGFLGFVVDTEEVERVLGFF